MKQYKIVTILGTRPEIIKLSPLIPLLDRAFSHRLIHTGQHYSAEMDAVFFKELDLRKPDFNLNVGSGTQAEQTAKMIVEIESILAAEKPHIVLVQGDTNTTLSGALAAAKLGIRIAHVEAGCRSFDKSMPEEINRIVTDHCSALLFAPDRVAYKNLVAEGISEEKIHLAGSTVADACMRSMKLAGKSEIMKTLRLEKGNFILVTVHRAGNTDDIEKLRGIVSALAEISEKTEIVFPVHPRTKKALEENNIELSKNIKAINPAGYLDFLNLLSNARFAMTDSGGIQEEAALLNTPCLILRNETEWSRLVEEGKNMLVGDKKEGIVKGAMSLLESEDALDRMRTAKASFDFGASKKITETLEADAQQQN